MFKRRVLITGSTGYIGHALVRFIHAHADLFHDFEFFTADNDLRAEWVTSCGGCSLTDYEEVPPHYADDLSIYLLFRNILKEVHPSVIVHLASQPSAPYSERDAYSRIYTQKNNLAMLQNILYGSRDLKLSPAVIVTTTTGIPGAPSSAILEEPMANLAGSSYHVSRGFDSANLGLAARQWGFRCLELRTSIVYGVHVDDVMEPVTRLDWDFFFGTVVHRFLVSSLVSVPIPIYGKGSQKKPIIALRDVVMSLANAILRSQDMAPGHEIMNQVTECLPVYQIADKIGGEVRHVPNPRVENEEHQMEIRNEKFLKLLNIIPTTLSRELHSLTTSVDIGKIPHKDFDRIFKGAYHS